MTLDPRTQAILYRFLLILAVTDLPILSTQLVAPVFDWRFLLAGLLTGAGAALEKAIVPQVANVILPNTTVMAGQKEGPGTVAQGVTSTARVIGTATVPPLVIAEDGSEAALAGPTPP